VRPSTFEKKGRVGTCVSILGSELRGVVREYGEEGGGVARVWDLEFNSIRFRLVGSEDVRDYGISTDECRYFTDGVCHWEWIF
jgi:hypothetical protein